MTLMITGGAGFIGSALIHHLVQKADHEPIVCFDKLTYAGNLNNLPNLHEKDNFIFVQGDICDQNTVQQIFNHHSPRAVLHLAAESHVDRSIDGAADFIQTNIVGTFTLLETARQYWLSLDSADKDSFRFLHVSTDEVYGDLTPDDDAFTEQHRYQPSSPYSASKAGSDHLVRAWHHTHGMPTLITNCSNNYGPRQFPEKLIPTIIEKALSGQPLPIYGSGQQIRDWLYVDDHAAALATVIEKGRVGETYNIGGDNEKTNLSVVHNICDHLDEVCPKTDGKSYRTQITHVTDRPGHDQRYAINNQKITRDLGWAPQETFDTGLKKTIQWYLDNRMWVDDILSGNYRMQRQGLS